jgi:hypothetical protein
LPLAVLFRAFGAAAAFGLIHLATIQVILPPGARRGNPTTALV